MLHDKKSEQQKTTISRLQHAKIFSYMTENHAISRGAHFAPQARKTFWIHDKKSNFRWTKHMTWNKIMGKSSRTRLIGCSSSSSWWSSFSSATWRARHRRYQDVQVTALQSPRIHYLPRFTANRSHQIEKQKTCHAKFKNVDQLYFGPLNANACATIRAEGLLVVR